MRNAKKTPLLKLIRSFVIRLNGITAGKNPTELTENRDAGLANEALMAGT